MFILYCLDSSASGASGGLIILSVTSSTAALAACLDS